tara:strand:+ start:834 stop:1028 length:195 start_codon:yes stop_codon:yes gene_type:complete
MNNKKQNKMKVLDWNITGSLIKEKFNLNITYVDNKKDLIVKKKTITDTLSNLIKIKNTFNDNNK